MPGDRLRRERPDRVRHRADQPAVDVNRAAAHPGGDAGFRQRTALEPRQDQIAVRPLDVAQHADDVRLELLEVGALEHRAADADHSWLDFVERHEWRGRGQRNPAEDSEGDSHGGSADLHMGQVRKRVTSYVSSYKC